VGEGDDTSCSQALMSRRFLAHELREQGVTSCACLETSELRDADAALDAVGDHMRASLHASPRTEAKSGVERLVTFDQDLPDRFTNSLLANGKVDSSAVRPPGIDTVAVLAGMEVGGNAKNADAINNCRGTICGTAQPLGKPFRGGPRRSDCDLPMLLDACAAKVRPCPD